MNANKREKVIYGQNVEILKREDDCTIYRISDEAGEVVMTSYTVFSGIELIYNDVHIRSCDIERGATDTILEINHCREGRIECGFQNEYVYLAPGDLTISKKNDAAHSSYFPLSHYHGITISIDLDRVPACLDCILSGVNIEPSQLCKKFCSDEKCYIERANPAIDHIFSELYHVPENIRKGYFKVKVLELLLFFSGMELSGEDTAHHSFSPSQVELAKAVCQYLTEHMEDKVTLTQLSDAFHASGTLIKSSFKGVYGISVYAYIRTQKMQEAARQLLHTDGTVLAVAGHFGYDSASKFAAAFRAVIGVSPAEYRRKYKANPFKHKSLNGTDACLFGAEGKPISCYTI